jgi:hypothetical protein
MAAARAPYCTRWAAPAMPSSSWPVLREVGHGRDAVLLVASPGNGSADNDSGYGGLGSLLRTHGAVLVASPGKGIANDDDGWEVGRTCDVVLFGPLGKGVVASGAGHNHGRVLSLLGAVSDGAGTTEMTPSASGRWKLD